MAAFMTRVELHGASYQDYVTLHGYMGQEGFSNTIRADNGTIYELPPAEYNLVANCTRDQALEKAKRAAQKTFKKFAVVVSEYTGCSWIGLTQVQQRARA
jgi:hypothetical protein